MLTVVGVGVISPLIATDVGFPTLPTLVGVAVLGVLVATGVGVPSSLAVVGVAVPGVLVATGVGVSDWAVCVAASSNTSWASWVLRQFIVCILVDRAGSTRLAEIVSLITIRANTKQIVVKPPIASAIFARPAVNDGTVCTVME